MQSYFYWDIPLPTTKKARITEIPKIDINRNPEQLPEAEKEIHVIEEQINVLAYPRRWYKGKSSSGNTDATDPKAKGKGVAKDN